MSVLPFITRQDGNHEDPASVSAQQSNKPIIVGNTPRRVLIIGAGTVGCTLARSMNADPRYEIIGFVDDEVRSLEGMPWPILGPNQNILNLIQEYSIDEVVVAYAPTWQQELMDEITQKDLSVQVRVVPSYFEAMMFSPRIESIGDVALLSIIAPEEKIFDFSKRFFDIFFALVVLVLSFPLMVFAAIAVKVTSSGPILFTQERVGQYGRFFTLLKFRTMRVNAESSTGPVLSAGRNDPRLTPIGYWLRLVRIDELPQLINVLRGEMSLVGPRPERPHFVKAFIERNPLYARRHEVRPGITGLAQVHGGYHTDARDKLRFDLFYISHRSLFMDVSILVRTFTNILTRPDGC